MDADRERGLREVRERVLAGSVPPGGASGPATRTAVAASWRRVAACGLQPGATPTVAPLPTAEVESRRAASGLQTLLPRLTSALSSLLEAGQLVVVADTEGRVLWRAGSSGVRRMADGLGFVSGSAWTEANVGTNAIGTSLVLGSGVQIQGPEHFVDSHTVWGCAAAPVRDPWSGRTLGVVDVSGPSRGMHPAELALVELAAELAGHDLLEQHRAGLDRLRAQAAPLLARMGGDAVAVDRHGRLAAGTGARLPDRVALPQQMAGGRVWLPGLGVADAEPLGDGWLLRLRPGGGEDDAGQSAVEVVLDLVGEPCVRVHGPSGSWSRALSPRHTEILLALVEAGPAGRTATGLAEDLFDDAGRAVTARAEMSRLRRSLGSLLLSGPYRFSSSVSVRLALPDERAAVLPASSAPAVRRLLGRGVPPSS